MEKLEDQIWRCTRRCLKVMPAGSTQGSDLYLAKRGRGRISIPLLFFFFFFFFV